MKIVISDKDSRLWKYYLGLKYGTRKGIKKLIECAVRDVVATVAREELKKAMESEDF